MKKTVLLHLLSFFVFSLFANCSGSNTGPLPIDAEFIMGKRPDEKSTYYLKTGTGTLLAIQLNKDRTSAVLFSISEGHIQKVGDIKLENIFITEDKKYLTITSVPGVFSLSSESPETLAKIEALPENELEALCLATPFGGAALGTTNYRELRLFKRAENFELFGVNGTNQVSVFGQENLLLKTETALIIGYDNVNAGTLSVNKNSPYTEDPAFFISTVSLWPSVTNLVCRMASQETTPFIPPAPEALAMEGEPPPAVVLPTGPVTWSPSSCFVRDQGPMVLNAPNYSRCPTNYGVFVTGNGNDYGAICCRLPADDILTGPTTVRSNTCGANEVGIGAMDAQKNSTQIYCQAINTLKYKLGTKRSACSWNSSGTYGWGSATGCSGEAPVIGGIWSVGTTTITTVGTDGCTGSPYGSFWVERKSKSCSSHGYSQLLNLDNTPVVMHAP